MKIRDENGKTVLDQMKKITIARYNIHPVNPQQFAAQVEQLLGQSFHHKSIRDGIVKIKIK
jgi:hypothetical protein